MNTQATVEKSWIDDIDTIDQSTVETSEQRYPWVMWVNGQPAQKRAGGVPYTGGWFVSDKNIKTAPQDWEPGEMIHRDNSATTGYFRRDLTVAIVAMRRRWIDAMTNPPISFPWSDFERAKEELGKRPTGHIQVLAVLRDAIEVGPVVLTLKGTVASRFMSSRDGVLGLFNEYIIRAANELALKAGKNARWPMRAFWLAVGPDRDPKDLPIFTEVGQPPNSSTVVFPALRNAHEKMTPAEVKALFVGRDLLEQLNDLYGQVLAWRNAWDAPSAQTELPMTVAAEKVAEEMPF